MAIAPYTIPNISRDEVSTQQKNMLQYTQSHKERDF